MAVTNYVDDVHVSETFEEQKMNLYYGFLKIVCMQILIRFRPFQLAGAPCRSGC